MEENPQSAQIYQRPVQQYQQPQPVVAAPLPVNKKSHVLDSIGFIFMFISMYFTASAIGMILHYYATRFFKPSGSDVGDSIWSIFGYLMGSSGVDYVSPVVYYSAALIVAFPVFATLFLIMTKRTMENPEIRELKARKYLIYFTLIITFILILYKVISLVFSLLTGNINMDFFSHFLITVGVSGVIFAYCITQAIGDHKQNA